jgi:hypothetical protein
MVAMPEKIGSPGHLQKLPASRALCRRDCRPFALQSFLGICVSLKLVKARGDRTRICISKNSVGARVLRRSHVCKRCRGNDW